MEDFQHWDTFYITELCISSTGKFLLYLNVTLSCCFAFFVISLAKESKQLFGDLDLSVCV